MSIQVTGLTKIYGEQKAVDNISFTAGKGRITGFLGPNGAGKSTTMKIATGYLPADFGEVVVDDLHVSREPLKIKEIIGYLPEHNPLYLPMYVKEFLAFIAKTHKIGPSGRNNRIREIIDLCGLHAEQHKKIGALSKGYRQRVGLAKALISDPSVLILDEPTTGLDPNQIVEIRHVIKEISREKTVLLSTHIMQEVEALCDQVVIINRGKIVADDTLINLKRSESNNVRLRVEFEEEFDSSLFEDLPGLIELKKEQLVLEIESKDENVRNQLLKVTSENNLPLVSIRTTGGTLEEIFQTLTRKESGS